jgi:23S rRNA pseudouridine1911/1915/1917 synthase
MTTSSNKILVAEKDAGKRLDIFLSEKLEKSRSQVQKMIEQELVRVNSKLPKKAGDKLSAKDVIIIDAGKKPSLPAKSEIKIKNKKTAALTDQIKITDETADYFVVEKPAGLLTHPTMAREKESLAGFLVSKYKEIVKVGEDPARPGIVHRLDRDASGLLVVARTQNMFNFLKEQFKNRTIEKEYMVLVHGKVARDWGEINFPLKRSGGGGRMAAIPETGNEALEDEAKLAKTEFLIEKKFINYTLLRVKIHTGRMHQIRAHFLAYNHPVVGDELYFQKKQKRDWDKKLGRLFLHCTKLVFTDLEGVRREYNSPLPQNLKDFLGLVK